MRVEITKLTSWKDVLNSARFTQRKEDLDKEPSIEFKKKIIKSEHSPLRCLIFSINMYDIPNYASVHFTRHIHSLPFVSTSRPDIDGKQLPREEQKKIDPVNLKLVLNAQEMIHISKARLCNKSEQQTREIWQMVLDELEKIEPELYNACVPLCFYRGFCPEFNSCGFANGRLFKERRELYISKL